MRSASDLDAAATGHGAGACGDAGRQRPIVEALLALALATRIELALLANLLAGAAWLTTNSMLNATLQLAVPRQFMGRMISIYMVATYLGLTLGSSLWGMIADLVGTRSCLLIAAAANIASTSPAVCRLRIHAHALVKDKAFAAVVGAAAVLEVLEDATFKLQDVPEPL